MVRADKVIIVLSLVLDGAAHSVFNPSGPIETGTVTPQLVPTGTQITQKTFYWGTVFQGRYIFKWFCMCFYLCALFL